MATDLFLEMAELPATGSLGTGQLDTRDLLVAGVPISISSKYLYPYLALKVLTQNVGVFVKLLMKINRTLESVLIQISWTHK